VLIAAGHLVDGIGYTAGPKVHGPVMDSLDLRPDAELLRGGGDEAAAFAELYRRHAPTVHDWFRRRIAAVASDLTAETFAQAWLSRRRFRDQRDGSALPWLLGIARNTLRASARRHRVETRARARLGLPLDLATEDGYDRVDARLSLGWELTRALDELPEHERSAVELRVVDQLAYAEIADRLAIRPAAARLRVSRGLRRLANTPALTTLLRPEEP
jgi:RNA polymerase sigma factor (sigma-70 family)